MNDLYIKMVNASGDFNHIPTQREIQDLCKKYNENEEISDYKLLLNMRVQICGFYCDKFLRLLSMEALWFIYYMKIKHRKIWNNGVWSG